MAYLPRTGANWAGDLPSEVRTAPRLGFAGVRDRRARDREYAPRRGVKADLAHERRPGRHRGARYAELRGRTPRDSRRGGRGLPNRGRRSASRPWRRVVRDRGERRSRLESPRPDLLRRCRKGSGVVPHAGGAAVTVRFFRGQLVQTACIWEATARKVGNVHRNADFAKTSLTDFLISAAAIAPYFDGGPIENIGGTIHHAVKATREAVGQNTNLGILLLLTPLATIPRTGPLPEAVPGALAELSWFDAEEVFARNPRSQIPAGLAARVRAGYC